VVAPLLAFIFSTLITYLTKANDHGVDIVRQVKSGVNPSSVHLLQFDGPYVGEVAKIGLIVAVVGLTVGVFK
jgi:low affinity sulfate transporter 2